MQQFAACEKRPGVSTAEMEAPGFEPGTPNAQLPVQDLQGDATL